VTAANTCSQPTGVLPERHLYVLSPPSTQFWPANTDDLEEFRVAVPLGPAVETDVDVARRVTLQFGGMYISTDAAPMSCDHLSSDVSKGKDREVARRGPGSDWTERL